MATGTTPDNREFLFRLQTLIIDGGTEVLRNIFDEKLQNIPLHAFLARERASINRLQTQNIITRTQYNQLYPQGGQHPNSADLDITIIICLLRNINFFGLRRNYSWQTQPQPLDQSVEADICRLKGFRNKVAHISSTKGFNKTTFQTLWNDIEAVLLRLNGALTRKDPHLAQTIDDYRNRSLDPAAESILQSKIEEWQDMEKDLDSRMELIHQDVITLTNEVREVQGNVGFVRKSVQRIEQMMSDQKETNIKQKEDIGYVKVKTQKVEQMIGYVKEKTHMIEQILLEQKKVKEPNQNKFQMHPFTTLSTTPPVNKLQALAKILEKRTKTPYNVSRGTIPSKKGK